MKLRALLFATIVLSACSTVSPLAPGDSVTAERVGKAVRITNGTTKTIPYVVWDQGFLGLLGPCDATCPQLKAGESVTVQPNQEGFAGNGNAVVYWWDGIPDPKGPVEPNAIIVK